MNHLVRTVLFTLGYLLLPQVGCKDAYLDANLACVAKYPTKAQIDACRLLTHDAGPHDAGPVATLKDGGSQ